MEEQKQEQQRTERFPIHIDRCLQITVGEVARLQRDGGKGYAFIYDETPGDYIAYFKIERITDGRGRYWQCDGKLSIFDRAFGLSDYPLIWKNSQLGRGGFWVIVGAGHYARKLYRTFRGWCTFQEYRNCRGKYDNCDRYHGHALYETQTESSARREGRGHGRWGYIFVAMKYEDLADKACTDKYRKWCYNGKPTPYGKRMRKRFAKLKPQVLPHLRKYPDWSPQLEMDCIRYYLRK